jgi:hypothetical protein
MNRSVTQALVGCALAAALAATLPSPAIAGVPSATNSTLPACMVLCPMGDMPFSVTVRDLANNPLNGASVVISFDFGACENSVFICEQLPSDPYLVNAPALTIRMFTDANGNVTFPARVGGTAPAGCVGVFANGVLLRTYALASPDQNGNGMTANLLDPGDFALFAAKLGTADPTADLDCDGGLVDADDQVIYSIHAAHSCVGYVDAVSRKSWGSLKLHYR